MRWRRRRSASRSLRVSGVTTAPSAVRRESSPTVPGRLWVADLADLHSAGVRLFVCVVLDCRSAGALGWRCGPSAELSLIRGAVDAAVRAHRRRLHALDHGPLGRRVALALTARCAAAGLEPPERARPNRADEAVAARFFSALRSDLLCPGAWPTLERAQLAIDRWIVHEYNPRVRTD
jgi:transposase InsO family protein